MLVDEATDGKIPEPGVDVKKMGSGLAQAYAIVARITFKRGEVQKNTARANTKRENSNAGNGYSKLFRQLRANQAPPCSLLKINGEHTSDMGRIHKEFGTKWEEVFNRLKNKPPNYEAFRGKYAKYLAGTDAGDLLPNANQLRDAARRSKGTAPGVDGWMPSELAILPQSA